MPRQASTHVDDPKAAGARLREARKRAGLSQRDLAFPGCSPAYISRIEAGQRVPSLHLLRELGRRLGVSEDYLASGSEQSAFPDPLRLLDAEIALRLDEVDAAEKMYREALDRSSGDRERARALAGLGQVAFRKGEPLQAIDTLEQALQVDGSLQQEDAGLSDTLGRAYAMIGDLEHAISVFERSLAAAEHRGDDIEVMRFAVLLANALIDTGNFGRADEVLDRIQEVAGHSRNSILRARLYWSRSRLYGEQGDPHLAARFARRALEILQHTDYNYYTARAYQLLAYTEIDRGRPEEALELLRKGTPLLREGANPVERAQFQLEEARALAALGRSQEAAALATELSTLLEDASPEDAGRAYTVLAEIFENLGDRSRALELYERAVQLLKRNPNRFLVSVYTKLADLLKTEGRKDEAIEALEKAVQLRLPGPSAGRARDRERRPTAKTSTGRAAARGRHRE